MSSPSLWAAIESIASKIGCVPQTLHEWVNRDVRLLRLYEGTTQIQRLIIGRELLRPAA